MPSQAILEQKKQVVEELTDKIKRAKSFVLADYRGITVEQATELRNELRKANVEYKVIKNSIIKFAVNGNSIEGFDEFLEGPTAIAISYDDMIAPSKVLYKFSEKCEAFNVKVGYVDGEIYNLDKIKQLAEIPSREEMIAKMLSSLNAPISGLAVALKAIADQKGE